MIRFSPSLRMVGDTGQLSEFIDGLGPGQLVGRQVLGAPALGDIQLSLCHQKGYLEVEVIRARELQVKWHLNFWIGIVTNIYFKIQGPTWFQTASSAIRKGLFGVWQKVHSKSQNDCGTKNFRPTISAAASVSGTISRMYFASEFSCE